ncbi:MAG: single-stranded DNA-binding protein [Pseudomonadales bacterium]|jgi:single-strand DNA-binding protein|nr:single-stranded DNA-binding protein [Pseudomonadales bacterium]
MARGINKVILIGNLGADPETRFTQGGSPVTNFRLATSEQWRDKQSNDTKERTEWHAVVCFGRLAEIAGEFLRKGSKVYVEGSLRTSSWESDGQTRYKTEIIANEMQMLDSRGGAGGGMGGGSGAGDYGAPSRSASGGSSRPRQPEPVANPDTLDDFDDDIPF